MSYKEITLFSRDISSALNEVKFELATARAESVELLVVKYSEDESLMRFLPKASFLLRRMKQRRRIQLFATPENFIRMGTESVYLKNKYPDIFTNYTPAEKDKIIYIKL